MATIKQYASTVWDTQQEICRKLGFDPRVAELPARVMIASTAVMLGAVLRIIFLKNVATDTEMNAIFTALRNAEYPQLPFAPPAVPEDGSAIPPPDLGV
jgi:hypothetical protein